MREQSSYGPAAFGTDYFPFQVFFASVDKWPSVLGPLKAATRFQLEAAGFMNRRAQACLEIPTRLSHCRTPQDLVNEQMRFWRIACEQYVETSRRMTEALGAAFPSGGSEGLADRDRDYITFPEPRDAAGDDEPPARKPRRVA